MKKLFVIFLTLISISVFAEEIVTSKNGNKIILYDDHTWAEYKTDTVNYDNLKNQLRAGRNATEKEIKTACEMLSQGWKYTMPRPKSAKAGWGISDGRTTWWYGYWYNSKTSQYSQITPKQTKSGLYLGDNQNKIGSWRNGGSPAEPDIYMFLLSDVGGPY